MSNELEEAIPMRLRLEERTAWLSYGKAVLSGAPRLAREATFTTAMRATEACLAVIYRQRKSRAAEHKAAA